MSDIRDVLVRALCETFNPGPFECCGQCADSVRLADAALAAIRDELAKRVPKKHNMASGGSAHNACRAAMLSALGGEG